METKENGVKDERRDVSIRAAHLAPGHRERKGKMGGKKREGGKEEREGKEERRKDGRGRRGKEEERKS